VDAPKYAPELALLGGIGRQHPWRKIARTCPQPYQHTGLPVWVQCDIAPSNLPMRQGRLSAIIDFGKLTIGDPTCDLAIAWALFPGRRPGGVPGRAVGGFENLGPGAAAKTATPSPFAMRRSTVRSCPAPPSQTI